MSVVLNCSCVPSGIVLSSIDNNVLGVAIYHGYLKWLEKAKASLVIGITNKYHVFVGKQLEPMQQNEGNSASVQNY